MWSELAWPPDGIKAFHTLLRQALMACERQHGANPEHDVVLRYLELVPRDAALYLEDPLRVPKPEGWTLEPLMAAAEEYYDLRLAYPTRDDNLGRRNRRSKPHGPNPNLHQPPPHDLGQLPVGSDPKAVNQNVTWDNDRKMMQAPLGSTTSEPKCTECTGTGHTKAECPNRYQATNEKWKSLPGEQKKKPCVRCGGSGHWVFMHPKNDRKVTSNSSSSEQRPPPGQRNQDCPAWAVGKCQQKCPMNMKHDPKKKAHR